MKKHIFGFAIFSFIFVSFALAFAYFYAPPVRQITEIKPLLVEPEYSPTSCRKKLKEIKSEVVDSQYIAGQNKVISRIKVSWSGIGVAPEKLYVTTLISSVDEKDKKSFGTYEILDKPFIDDLEKVFTLVSRNSNNHKIDKKTNLYARFSVTDSYTTGESSEENIKLTQATPVVYVHGDSPVGKK